MESNVSNNCVKLCVYSEGLYVSRPWIWDIYAYEMQFYKKILKIKLTVTVRNEEFWREKKFMKDSGE